MCFGHFEGEVVGYLKIILLIMLGLSAQVANQFESPSRERLMIMISVNVRTLNHSINIISGRSHKHVS